LEYRPDHALTDVAILWRPFGPPVKKSTFADKEPFFTFWAKPEIDGKSRKIAFVVGDGGCNSDYCTATGLNRLQSVQVVLQ
jgi:hypothetical protein